MMLQWDNVSNTYVKSTYTGIAKHSLNFVLFLTITGVLQSALTPSSYQPFYQATTQWYDVTRIFNLGQLGNNMLHARK